MPEKYELTPRAERDLKDIWLYTTEAWGDEQADKYVALLEKRFDVLVTSPFMGSSRPDIGQGYRCLPEGKHIIFYRIKDDVVEILGVPHASMDIERRLEQEK
ncbi:MAG: type II toxin-antitoxin system RelE/ParE family toxin [Thermodesulfobacteriota bacterium]